MARLRPLLELRRHRIEAPELSLSIDFDLLDAASIGIIGGADGPTSIFLSSQLSPELLGAIAVAAYSYMALVPIIQPPIMRLLTTEAERKIHMVQLREVSKAERILFPILLLLLVALLLPTGMIAVWTGEVDDGWGEVVVDRRQLRDPRGDRDRREEDVLGAFPIDGKVDLEAGLVGAVLLEELAGVLHSSDRDGGGVERVSLELLARRHHQCLRRDADLRPDLRSRRARVASLRAHGDLRRLHCRHRSDHDQRSLVAGRSRRESYSRR